MKVFQRYGNIQPQRFDLTRDDSKQFRTYYDSDGTHYLSVTSFVGQFSTGKAELENWKNAIGEVEANKIMKAAGTKGTAIHEGCEKLLLNQPNVSVEMFYRQDFNTMKKHLIEHVDNIFVLEHQMFSKKLKLAGTVDCIAEYDGEMAIIDFKTSSRLKYADELTSYYLQEAAYGIMAAERYGLQCKNLVTLMVVEGDPIIHVFKEKLTKWGTEILKLTREPQCQNLLLN
jgi:hypothetical protein